MTRDNRPWPIRARHLARSKMDTFDNLHRVNLAIVSTHDAVHVFEFANLDSKRMLGETIPTLVADTGATSVIVSSPANDMRLGVHVVLLERSIDLYYVPVIRLTNADRLIGDFRALSTTDCNRFGPVFEALLRNWIERDRWIVPF